MKYRTINELDTFDFNGGLIADIEQGDRNFIFIIDNVTIKSTNNCNRDIMDMRTNQLQLTFKNAVIEKIIEEGYKVYDADSRLQEVIEDRIVEKKEYDELWVNFLNCSFYSISFTSEQCCQLEINTDFQTYSIQICCEKTITEWERFMTKD